VLVAFVVAVVMRGMTRRLVVDHVLHGVRDLLADLDRRQDADDDDEREQPR
jgi:hypothetical protein